MILGLLEVAANRRSEADRPEILPRDPRTVETLGVSPLPVSVAENPVSAALDWMVTFSLRRSA